MVRIWCSRDPSFDETKLGAEDLSEMDNRRYEDSVFSLGFFSPLVSLCVMGGETLMPK